MKLKFLIILFLFTIIFYQKAFSQDNYSEKVNKKFTELLTKNEKVSKKDYDEFWSYTGIK
jgi:hypothetical protein